MSSAFRSGIGMALALICASCARPAEPVVDGRQALRVCADPNNLPFSNQAGEGFENKIAELIADRLDRRVEYTWWAQRRGFLRNTLRAGICDVVLGVPSGIEMALTTQPYYRSSYVFVTRQDAPHPESFDDPYLGSARVGVHIIGDDFSNSPPAHALSNRGYVDNIRGYSVYGDYRTPNPPAALIEGVARGEIDVAVAWGPLAGYFAGKSNVPLHIARVHPDEEPPYPFVFDMAMGVARPNQALKDTLNGIIVKEKTAIDGILRAYGVPLLEPERVAAR